MIPDVDVPPEAKVDEKPMDEKTQDWLSNHAKPHTWINGVMLAASETLGAPIIIWWKSQKNVWRRHTCAPAFDRNGYAKMAKTAKAIVVSLEKGETSY
jgi:hypothetical protein